jgi:DNA-binding NtrC family response regulator
MEKENFRILIVEDEKSIAILLSRILKKEGYNVKSTTSPEKALEIIRHFSPNLIISDLKMPRITGLELLQQVKPERPEIDFIIITAYATVENAVDAMKSGAFDYLIKPLKDPDELRIAVSKVVERQRLIAANTLWENNLSEGLPPAEILFCGMEKAKKEIEQVADSDATVLFLGESGTGKSLIARALHHISGKKGAFVEINCAAIPENLIESELFGHEKGAFTGAVKAKQGKFELASDGTIFLDEIGEMPLDAQAKLLRILQEKTFERVGGTNTLHSNARIVAATNQDLIMGIKERRFREDLYYRLSVFPVHLPPLRQRAEAIPVIAEYLTGSIARKLGKRITSIVPGGLETLSTYDWPGNIRELHNFLERAIILETSTELDLPAPGHAVRKPDNNKDKKTLQVKKLEDMEREAIEAALEKTDGHRGKASEILGISLRALQYKLKKYRSEK